MKPMLSVLVISAIFFFSCKKEDDTPSTSELLSGTYIGPSASRSTSLQMVYTSQYESHEEWVTDSSIINFDTLHIRQISRDSFVMEGPVGNRLSQWWQVSAWSEFADSNGIYTVKKGFGYYSGSFNYTLIVDAPNRTAKVDWNAMGNYPPGTASFVFEGVK